LHVFSRHNIRVYTHIYYIYIYDMIIIMGLFGRIRGGGEDQRMTEFNNIEIHCVYV
jgi:hypothetical protein